MVTIPVKIGTDEGKLDLGIRGENEARQIVFDCTSLAETYGTGTAIVMCKRPGDTDPYPCASTQDGNTVTWVLSNADTAYAGYGKVELWWYVDEVLAKTIVFISFIANDIGETEDPPEPWEGWVDEVLQAAQEVENMLATTIYIDNNGQFKVHE